MSANYDKIKGAILNGNNISAKYNGYYREMTPHTLGHSKKGREQCLCYQFGGESSSANEFPENSPENWRCIPVEELVELTIIGGGVHTCDKHTKTQTCVAVVDVELKF